jgi:hypothetical protein
MTSGVVELDQLPPVAQQADWAAAFQFAAGVTGARL